MALLKIHNPELGGILLDISRSRGYIFTYIPHLGDIYKYISPKWGIYVNFMENQDFLTYFEIQKEPSKWDIYCIYGVFSSAPEGNFWKFSAARGKFQKLTEGEGKFLRQIHEKNQNFCQIQNYKSGAIVGARQVKQNFCQIQNYKSIFVAIQYEKYEFLVISELY